MDHLEILYDLDVKAQAEAKEIGMTLSRTPMPNDDPLLVKMLSELVAEEFTSERAKAELARGLQPAGPHSREVGVTVTVTRRSPRSTTRFTALPTLRASMA